MILHGYATEQAINGADVGVFYKEVMVTEGAVPLSVVRKRRMDARDGTRAPVLLIHGFGQNRYAWHLPSRSFVNHLANAGFDVFNLDLRGHGRSRQLSSRKMGRLSEYVREDVPAAIEEVQRVSGPRPVYLIGHSLGGLVSLGASPWLSGKVAGVVAIGTPYSFGKGAPLALRALALMARGLRKARLEFDAPLAVYAIGEGLRSLRAVAETPLSPIPVRGWAKRALEPLVLDEHFRLAFDHAGLGELTELLSVGDFSAGLVGAAAFEQQDLPLLVIAGTHDDLAPPESVRPAYARSRSRDKEYVEHPLGHIDLLVGKEAPDLTWKTVTRWLDRHTPA